MPAGRRRCFDHIPLFDTQPARVGGLLQVEPLQVSPELGADVLTLESQLN
jgi:hypothetical protein